MEKGFSLGSVHSITTSKLNPQYEVTIESDSVTNLIDQLYFGTVEKTYQESAYYPASMYKPYNPDDLYQKTGDYSIYEDMLVDDQVSVCMNIKKDLVIGSGWDLITEENSPIHAEIKKKLEEIFNEDIEIPFDCQLDEILSAYSFGFSLSEKVFKKQDDKNLALKFLKTRHPSTWLIHTDSHGNINRLEQRGRSGSIDVPMESIIHCVNQSKFQNPYGTSDLRSAYNAWFVKRQIIRYYGIFMEKAASPVPVAKYPINMPRGAVDDIHTAIKKFQTKTALTIPKEMDIDFLESKNNGEVFTKGINIFNMFIGRSLMIPDLLGFQGSETIGGSYNLGENQMRVFFKHIQRRRIYLENLVNKHLIWPLVVYNFGYVDHYPKFKLKPIDDDQAIDLAKLWIEIMKGRLYKPGQDEINHFKKLIKFPEGDVEIFQDQGQAPAGGLSRQISMQPKMPDMDQMPSNERMMSYEFKEANLPPGEYHKKVDFKLIDSDMTSFVGKIMKETGPIAEKIFQDLFDQIEQKKIIKDQRADRIESIKPKYLKEMKTVLKSIFRDIWKTGKLEGQKELIKGSNFRTPLPDEAFMEVLEAETFQYVGDWSYSIGKTMRKVLFEAIRDGKPLSSVIDQLEEELDNLSKTSIERFSRTKITDVMNRARLASFNESGVVAAYQYSAILDDRTSEICSALDGKIFENGTEPIPPLHFNCRSLLIPITKYEDYEADDKIDGEPIFEFIKEHKGDGFSIR